MAATTDSDYNATTTGSANIGEGFQIGCGNGDTFLERENSAEVPILTIPRGYVSPALGVINQRHICKWANKLQVMALTLIYGLTVGRSAGAVLSNTTLGTNALDIILLVLIILLDMTLIITQLAALTWPLETML